MLIKVINRAQAVEVLRRGDTLWCRATGEGWQLCDPTSWSKRAIRRKVALHYRDARWWTGQDVIHFYYNSDGE